MIDVHTHAFPSPGEGRRWQRMFDVREPSRSGALDDLRDRLEAAGIGRAVLLLATVAGERERVVRGSLPDGGDAVSVPAQLRKEIQTLNRWGCEVARSDDRFLPFIGIDVPWMTPAESVAEIDASVALGARGVKIVPDSMRRYPDDPLLEPIFDRCQALGLPLLAQAGIGRVPPPSSGADHYGRPARFEGVLRNFPDLVVILAHLGHGYEDDVVRMAARFPGLHTDLSMRLNGRERPGHPGRTELVDLVRRIGTDRVLFGSNYPFTDPVAYVHRMQALPLRDDERELLTQGNWDRIEAACRGR